MNKLLNKYTSIALVKEIESPENPSGLEKRVALVPNDIKTLVDYGIKVYVEYDAGNGVGFSDEEYINSGAIMQESKDIYKNKDMIIKFKGPSLESIKDMDENCTLFCMAHFHSFPSRAKMLEDAKINVIAMEEILESPKAQDDEIILGRLAMKKALSSFINSGEIKNLKVFIIGRNNRLAASIRRAGNRAPYSLSLLSKDIKFNELSEIGKNALYFYDSSDFNDKNNLISELKKNNLNLFDLSEYEKTQAEVDIKEYKSTHKPLELGLRRIQCLEITGMAGARYGLKLLKENKKDLDLKEAKVVVLGYGNVASGAMLELYNQGIKKINILGRRQTNAAVIEEYIKDADLIINGAELPSDIRGKVYILTNDHLKYNLSTKSVVIDLVGGSQTNRSPIEAVLDCTFLTDPHFEKNNVTVSALWGWPMLGMMKESTIRYSSQIIDVLLKKEKLIEGLNVKELGLKRALVCGPFN